jgi:hypothetical protein
METSKEEDLPFAVGLVGGKRRKRKLKFKLSSDHPPIGNG